MALGVLNNLSAIYAENNLNNTNSSLQTVLQQLSSGSKINSGADDAAGLSLVNGLEANQTALTQSETNSTEGVGLLDVADGALSQVTSMLDRAITLATEASNGTLNSTQEGAANNEYQSILAEVNNIGQTTTYNQQQVFSGNTVAIYTGDSSAAGSSVDDLNIRTLSEASVGDTGGAMSYSDGASNVFLNLSTGSKNALATDTLNASGATTIDVTYLVKGGNGTASTATTTISVGGATNYPNTASGLISAVNNAGLGLTASFATQAQAGVSGGGTQTGIQITGGLVSAGVDPSSASTSGTLDPAGIPASELLTQGQTINVSIGGTSVGSVAIGPLVNTLAEVALAINGWNSNNSPVTATVITNGNGTQSLSLADAAVGGAALTVVTEPGGGAAVPVLSAPSTAANTVNLSGISGSPVTGTGASSGGPGTLTLAMASAANPTWTMNQSADTVTGTIQITNTPLSGAPSTLTFSMGGGAYLKNGNAVTVGGTTLGALATAIQTAFGGGVTAAVTPGTGLVVTAAHAGDNITTGSDLLQNTNAALGLYSPTLAAPTVYGSALLAITSMNGNDAGSTAVEGNILGTDTLTGSFTLTNGITSQTFVMGGVGGPSTTGSTTDVGGTTIGALLAAINSTTIAGPDLGIVATQNLTGNGGLWLQSTTTNTTISMSPSTLVDSYSEAPTPFAGVPPSGGTESFNEILPASGSVNTGDVLTGSVKLTNGPTQHTFVMGAGPAVAGPAGVLTGNSVQVNGNTLADLAAAISWDAPMDLTAQADTTGLSMTTTVNDGDPINVSANSLVDTTQGTFSTMTLGTAGNQFASESDIVSGALDFSVGGAAKTVPLSPGETVAEMINQINNPTGLSNPNYPDGVTATWVPSTNGFGSVVLTANLAGTSGQISAATSTVTDTTTTANLSYTGSSAYNTGLSSAAATNRAVYDSISGQTTTPGDLATFVTNTHASSGAATVSYADGAGQALNTTDLLNQADAETALNELNVAIGDVAAQDGYIGAQINTLNSVSQVMSTQHDNVVSAQNAVQATDYASATANMSKYEILSQTGIAALAQANTVQQEVTKLLQ